MKLVALTSAALLAATTAFAGNVNFESTPDVPVVIETPAPAAPAGSGSGPSWLLPAVGIAVVGGILLACHGEDDD